MSVQNPSAKSAINPLAFLPFGVYAIVLFIQILLNFNKYGAYYAGNDGFLGFLRDWILPGVFLFVAAFTVTKKVMSIAFAVAAILWQLLVARISSSGPGFHNPRLVDRPRQCLRQFFQVRC